jgi:MFS family permease
MMALLAESISPVSYGLTYGLYGAGEDVGVLLGPLISGYVYEQASPSLAFNVFAIVMFVGAVCAFLFLKKIKKIGSK